MHYSVRMPTDAVHWFLSEQTARIVADSGRPCDRFHIGKLILQSFRDAPEFIAQIDGATGETETNRSLMERSILCAKGLKKLGLQAGDIIVLMAPNHIHVAVPIYAAMYLGIGVAATNTDRTVDDLHNMCRLHKPKAIFCQKEKVADVEKALTSLGFEENSSKPNVITFNEGSDYQNFNEFLRNFDDGTSHEDFKPSDFDTAETVSYLVETSGTTGTSKLVELTHKIFMTTKPYNWRKFNNFPEPTRMVMNVSQLQWLTSLGNFIVCPVFRITRLQSSLQVTVDHAISLINKYRPTFMIIGPALLRQLIEDNEPEKCDITCFELILAGGSVVPKEIIEKFKAISPNTSIFNAYAMSEAAVILEPVETPLGSSGRPFGLYQYRLIDIDSQEDITEAHKPGELWIKGPGLFKGYLRNPSATKEVFSEDGWFKTGDLLYRDENWNFFYVERIKLLLKYKNQQISPSELEGVIRRHAGVADVAVTGVPSPDGDLPVACVVPRPDHRLTPHDIKQLIKDTLDDSKQLKGVIFMDELRATPTGKIDRRKLKEIVLEMIDEIIW